MTPTPAIWAMAMSMNTMPRRSTWMPSGTCVAHTRRPARSAGSRILISICSMLFPRLIEARDRVVEQTEQIFGGRRAAHRIGQVDERFTGVVGEPFRGLRILVGAVHDGVGAFATDALDEFGQIARARRNTGLWFDVHDLHHAEPVDQIHRVLVIRHQPHPFQRCGDFLPVCDRGRPTCLEVLPAARIVGRVGWVETREPVAYNRCDLRDVVWIELNMRVAARMDITFGAIQPRRDFEAFNEVGGRDKTLCTGLYSGIAGRLQQYR